MKDGKAIYLKGLSFKNSTNKNAHVQFNADKKYTEFLFGDKAPQTGTGKRPETLPWQNILGRTVQATHRGQYAYHILWGVNFYLGANPESYIPFKNAVDGAESLGGSQDWENPYQGVVVEGIHTKNELISFIGDIENNLTQRIEALPLEENSGFEWYPYSRLELHINSIRLIQHHTAQIIERLKAKGITGFPWWIGQNQP